MALAYYGSMLPFAPSCALRAILKEWAFRTPQRYRRQLFDPPTRPLRPQLRARCLRAGVRGARRRAAHAGDGRGGARGVAQPGAPGDERARPGDGGRGRDSDPDPRRLSPPRVQISGHRASPRRLLRGGHVLRARRGGEPRVRGLPGADRRRGGAAVFGLPGRTLGAGPCRPDRPEHHAAHPAVLRRAPERRRLHKAVEETHGGYVVSLSSRTLVYKGLLKGRQLARFYPDLGDPHFASAIALVHERFSTNTLGTWDLAHPYRYVAHNGEINTLRGNINWMRARESRLESELFGEDLQKLFPVIQPDQSDSATFDNALELLHLAGRSLPHAVAMMMPEAYENDDLMDEERRAFFAYHSSLMEPGGGPPPIPLTDGKLICATLDRNGLRPARYSVTRDGRVVMASEDGALRVPADEVVERWRLQPGKMLVVDTEKNELLHDEDVKKPLFNLQPYKKWVEEGEVHLDELPEAAPNGRNETASLFERQLTFGYTMEDLRILPSPMARDGKEPDGSMGTDTPLVVLSERPQLLFSYFKQLFAQVTNPPIDPLREELVMSLNMALGPEQNLFDETPDHCRQISLTGPVLRAADLEKIRQLNSEPFQSVTLPMLFPANEEGGLEKALEGLCERAEKEVQEGSTVLVLSDRGITAEQAPIPSLLATAAVHHHLVRAGIRTRTTLIVETAEAREGHHFALLVGYGASAVNPYLAFETIEDMVETELIGDVTPDEASKNFVKANEKALLKIISKMGISTLFSYCGAQIFEAVGLSDEVIERYFTRTPSRIGGIGLEEIGEEVIQRHRRAVCKIENGPPQLQVGGEDQFLVR